MLLSVKILTLDINKIENLILFRKYEEAAEKDDVEHHHMPLAPDDIVDYGPREVGLEVDGELVPE